MQGIDAIQSAVWATALTVKPSPDRLTANAPALQECLRAGLCAMIPIYKSRTGSAWLWAIGRGINCCCPSGLTQQALEQEMPRLDTIPLSPTFSTWRLCTTNQIS